jgi:multicomponent Na+:H+ antiporter subunit B
MSAAEQGLQHLGSGGEIALGGSLASGAGSAVQLGPVSLELLMLVLLGLTAVVILRTRELFPAAMLTGVFSLLCAGLFTLMDAVDVAFTEAAVGAGVSTVFFLGALSMMDRSERQRAFRVRPLLAVVLTGAALIYGTFDMPDYGDPNAPVHQHVAPQYLAGARAVHIPNVVTVILASYRGYDTLGETVVVLTAAIGVVILLGGRRRRSANSAPSGSNQDVS